MPKLPTIAEAYNESVPLEFARALLAQARAHDKDVAAILQAARFPFDPLQQDVQTMFVSREQYSRLCVELFRVIGMSPAAPCPVSRPLPEPCGSSP